MPVGRMWEKSMKIMECFQMMIAVSTIYTIFVKFSNFSHSPLEHYSLPRNAPLHYTHEFTRVLYLLHLFFWFNSHIHIDRIRLAAMNFIKFCLQSGYWSMHKPFQCSQCNAAFCRKPYLDIHMRIHTGKIHAIKKKPPDPN